MKATGGRNKQKRSQSFTWEALIYEGWTQKEFPINLSAATNSRQQKTSFTVKAGSIKKLTLFTKEGPPFIETPNYSVRFRLVIRVTDEAKQSVQIRRSKVQFSISQQFFTNHQNKLRDVKESISLNFSAVGYAASFKIFSSFSGSTFPAVAIVLAASSQISCTGCPECPRVHSQVILCSFFALSRRSQNW